MNQFMKNYQVYLTPLTPIHIGCGEIFEPTNYVIDEDVLYHFDPSNLHLPLTKLNELLNVVQSNHIGKIQQFFQKNKHLVLDRAHYFSAVSNSLSQEWSKKLGNFVNNKQDSFKEFNQFTIERTSYLSYKNEPYIPGSSLKGALATAIIDYEHRTKGNKKLPNIYLKENRKLSEELVNRYIGKFDKSLLSKIKFSDLIPIDKVKSKIFYSRNFQKNGTQARGVISRRECILGGQYRVFFGELALLTTEENLLLYLQQLDQFSRNIFNKEIKLLQEKNFTSLSFIKSLNELITQSKGKSVLVRLGKNGAESKTLRGDGVAQIKIMGKKGEKSYKDHATTIWLAANAEDESSNLLPFGWALLEIKPMSNKTTADNELLKEWCEKQPKPSFDKANILDKQQALSEQKQQKENFKQAKLEEELREKEEKQVLFNSLNENQQKVVTLIEKFKASNEKQLDSNSYLLKEAKELINFASENWKHQDKQFIFDKITLELIKTRVDLKKKNAEKDFNKLRNKLN